MTQNDIAAQSAAVETAKKSLFNYAEKCKTIFSEISELEAKIKDKKKELSEIEENLMPGILLELGLTDFTTEDGTYVELIDVISASISEGNKPEAFDWLRKNNYGDIIKCELVATFAMGEQEKAMDIQAKIKEIFNKGSVIKDTVHGQTLKAFVKEQLAEGTQLPQDLFGVFIQQKVKIKEKK